MKNPIIPFYRQSDKVLVRSEKCFVYDAENTRYTDFESGDWAANLGHSHPAINHRIKTQVDKLIHDGLRFTNEESTALSFKLLEKLGMNEGQCAYLNSGSEAVNLGITVAKNLTGRRKVLKMDCSYLSAFGHGQTSDHNAELISIPMNNIEAISAIDLKEIAVFVFEPGNAGSLIKYPDLEFIETLAAEVQASGGLLMANEVTTGFGRTGKWFGFQHYNYAPDIVSVGKALGNGYPVSGIAINHRTASSFSQTPFRYAQSHQNDPLGCAVGLKVIETLEKENLIALSKEKGDYFKDQLLQLQAKYSDIVIDVRARGLMIGTELRSVELAEKLYNSLIENGYLTGQKESTIRFMPPLVIERSDIDGLIAAMDEFLSAV